jgi:iron complex outermembrane receptor protein
MRKWQLLGSVQLAVALSLASGLPVAAQESVENVDEWMSGRVDESEQPIHPSTHPPIHPSTPTPALTLSDWVAQIEASLVQITGVRVETTEAGLQILLDTAEGTLAAPTTQTVGNALIADIPNAVLALPDGGAFEQFAPAEGIALVAVTNEPGNRVRVAITGTDAPPVAEVTATGLAVSLGEAVVGAEDDAIQVVVTGEQDEGYNPRSASTATRTETPLRDIPQSIQIVPRQVLEDRNVRTLTEAVETVSGVVPGGAIPGSIGNTIIRGFSQQGNFRNGFRDVDRFGVTSIGTIEQVEVLKGPASVLFGALEPGGIVNVITRQPLSEPYYNLALEVGNYGFYGSSGFQVIPVN